MPRILLVAAMRAEVLALELGLRAQRSRADGDGGLRLVRLGIGPRRARQRTSEALSAWAPDAVLNLGTCGALDDALTIGDVLHVSVLQGRDGPFTIETLGGPPVTLSTVSRPVFQAAQRSALAAQGSVACEMEATGVAQACAERGVPLFVVKVVSDHAGGAADDVIPSRDGRLPLALATGRFSLRAFGLVRAHLAPRLPEWLAEVERRLEGRVPPLTRP